VSETLVDQFYTDGDVNTFVQAMAAAWYVLTNMADNDDAPPAYEGGPKNNRNLNVARELEVVARRV
jgi:hypothetical protein